MQNANFVPTEIIVYISQFIYLNEQVPIFTLLNKCVKQEFEKVVLSGYIQQALLHPPFSNDCTNSLFTNALEEIAALQSFSSHPLAKTMLSRSMAEFCFRYCTKFIPTPVRQSSYSNKGASQSIFHTANSLEKKLSNSSKTICTPDQTCSLVKQGTEAIWCSFYFPTIPFKAISGITYWFSFLLKEYNPTVGNNIWKILLGITDHQQKLSDLKIFSHSTLNYAFIVGTGEKLNGYGSGNAYVDLVGKIQQGDVITFSLDFADDALCPLQTLRMRLSVFCNGKPFGIMFSRCVPVESRYHPICALCETSQVVFRIDGISFKQGGSQQHP